MLIVPPHISYIIGFCSMWTRPGHCQNLGKSLLVAARADLGAHPICPLMHTLFVHWISANSQHGFAARSRFIFLTTQFQISHGNTAALSIHFCWTLLSEQLKPRLLLSMVQLGLWISTNSTHGFVARSNFYISHNTNSGSSRQYCCILTYIIFHWIERWNQKLFPLMW